MLKNLIVSIVLIWNILKVKKEELLFGYTYSKMGKAILKSKSQYIIEHTLSNGKSKN